MMTTWLAPAATFGSLVAAVSAVTKPLMPDVSLMVPIAGFASATTMASIYLARSARTRRASNDNTNDDRVWHAVVNIVALALSGVLLGTLYMRMTIVDHDTRAQQYTYFHNVVYEVAGDAPNGVTVAFSVYDPRGRPPLNTGMTTVPPWHQDVTVTGNGLRATLTVRMVDHNGAATCKITVDGTVIATQKASGQHDVAYCFATIGEI